jgi:hypothetical protein
MAVVSHAALLRTSDNIHPCADYAELLGFNMRQPALTKENWQH